MEKDEGVKLDGGLRNHIQELRVHSQEMIKNKKYSVLQATDLHAIFIRQQKPNVLGWTDIIVQTLNKNIHPVQLSLNSLSLIIHTANP